MTVTATLLSAADVESGETSVAAAANQSACTLSRTGNTVTISGVLDDLTAYTPADEALGEHKWITVVVDTGEEDITDVSVNGTPLTEEDAAEAEALNAEAGCFILMLKADVISTTPATTAMTVEGKTGVTLTFTFVDTAE